MVVFVGKSIRRRFCVLPAYCILLACIVCDPAAAQSDIQQASARLSFVRAFSSADDVRRPLHPVLDRTLDILAGSKDPDLRVGGLQSPSALATDSNERVFVADPSAKAVHIFDFTHSKYSVLEKGSDRLSVPVSLAVDGQDNLYVSDKLSGTILIYDSAGKFRHSLGTLSGGESYFESPAGIAIDGTTGRIYVCDTRRHMVIVMDGRGRLVAKAGKRGGGDRPGEFTLPSQAVIAAGELFVLDAGNARIQILDTALHFRRAISLAYADHRTGLAVDAQSNIYVSDPVLNRIEIFSHEGRLLYTFDPSTITDANFSHPSTMWISAGSCLYVVDSQSNRVGLFQIRGNDNRECR